MDHRNKAVFFDRDGTINVDMGYLCDPKKLIFIEGVPQLIKKYSDEGYLVIVVSNQSGVARGYFSCDDVDNFHRNMNDRLKSEYGTQIDYFYYCPHLEKITGECNCRKPKPGLFLRAIEEHNIDPSRSISYGNSQRDEIASRAAGICDFRYINSINGRGEIL